MSADYSFDPKRVQKVIEPKVNPWGLNIINDNCLELTRKKVKLTVQGGLRKFPLDRLEVTIKAERFPSLSVADVYRDTLDLYTDHRVTRTIQVISERIKVDRVQVREAIYSLTEALEGYRNHLISLSEEGPQMTIGRGQYKMSSKLQGLINSKRSFSQLEKLIDKTGLPGKELLFKLFVLSFSRYTAKPLHVVLIGDQLKCMRLLSDFSKLLPKTEFIKNSALHEKELFGQAQGFFSHKTIVGQDLSNLSEKSLLFQFLADGEALRIGHKRQKQQKVKGPTQLFAISSSGTHSFNYLSDVICLKLDEETYDQQSMQKELNDHAGLNNNQEEQDAIALL